MYIKCVIHHYQDFFFFHEQPSWRHLPHHDEKTMITYKSSDIRFSWADASVGAKPRVCGYVKEGKGRCHIILYYLYNICNDFVLNKLYFKMLMVLYFRIGG